MEIDVKSETAQDSPISQSDVISQEGLPSNIEIKVEQVDSIQCHVCDLLFLSQESLDRHKITHDVCHKCKFCDLEFNILNKLNEHFLHDHTDFDIDKLYCSICEQEFDSQAKLKAHIPKKHTHIFQHQCSHCEKTFYDLRELEAHENGHLGLKPQQCPVCSKSFSNQRRLDTHLLSHSGQKFDCPECGKSFARKVTLNGHMKVHWNPCAYQCDICQKSLSSKCSLTEHMRTHTSFKCKTCGEAFKKRLQLQYHALRHKGLSSFSCALCNSSFAAMYELRKHMLSHLNRQYKCNICQKNLANKKSLKVHMRRHTGDFRHKCDKCQSKFNTSTELKTHMFVHTRESDYQCLTCKLKFATPAALSKHQNRHLGIKPYQCDKCPKRFAQSVSLQEHIRGFHGPLGAVRCEKCDIVFRYYRSLRKHNYKKHFTLSSNVLSSTSNKSENIKTSSKSARPDSIKTINDNRMKPKSSVNKSKRHQSASKNLVWKKKTTKSATPQAASVPEELQAGSEIPLKKNEKKLTKKTFTTVANGSSTSAESKDRRKAKSTEKARTKMNDKKSSKIVSVKNKSQTMGSKSMSGKSKKGTIQLNKNADKSKYSKQKKLNSVQCHLCTAEFSSQDNLARHLQTHPNRLKSYRCELCSKTFTSRLSLNKHLNNHPKIELYDCQFCNMVFDQVKTLELHTAGHTETILKGSAKLHDGAEADREADFGTIANCSKNTEVVSNVNSVNSNLVEKRTSAADVLNFNRDIETELSDKSQGYSLIELAKLYADPIELHPSQSSSGLPFGAINIEKKHSGQKSAKSKKSISNKKSVAEVTEKRMSNKYLFQCDICQRQFASQGWLERHLKTHSPGHASSAKRKAPTAIKEKRKKQNDEDDTAVVLHILVNSEAKGLTSKDQRGHSSATRRERNQSDEGANLISPESDTPPKEKQFVCQYCEKRYVFEKRLVKHMKVHLEDLNFEANGKDPDDNVNDPASFIQNSVYPELLKAKQFLCQICDKQYDSKQSLTKHFKEIHSHADIPRNFSHSATVVKHTGENSELSVQDCEAQTNCFSRRESSTLFKRFKSLDK